AAGEIHLKVAAGDLAREGDIAAGIDRRVVIDSGEGEAGHQRTGCQTAEDARHPEAHAAFVGPGERRRRCDAAHDRDKSQSPPEPWLSVCRLLVHARPRPSQRRQEVYAGAPLHLSLWRGMSTVRGSYPHWSLLRPIDPAGAGPRDTVDAVIECATAGDAC